MAVAVEVPEHIRSLVERCALVLESSTVVANWQIRVRDRRRDFVNSRKIETNVRLNSIRLPDYRIRSERHCRTFVPAVAEKDHAFVLVAGAKERPSVVEIDWTAIVVVATTGHWKGMNCSNEDLWKID